MWGEAPGGGKQGLGLPGGLSGWKRGAVRCAVASYRRRAVWQLPAHLSLSGMAATQPLGLPHPSGLLTDMRGPLPTALNQHTALPPSAPACSTLLPLPLSLSHASPPGPPDFFMVAEELREIMAGMGLR